ncbi:MAG: hypothetical protein U1C74_24620 [Phenylobacterium sp.]|nr:hypothetical protein [Phenylobacterium sp.]
MVGIVQEVTVWLAAATDAVAVALISLAVLEALARTLALASHRRGRSQGSHDLTEDSRLRLARSLALWSSCWPPTPCTPPSRRSADGPELLHPT